MEIDRYSKKKISLSFLIIVSILLLFFDLIGQLNFIRKSSDYIFTPIVLKGGGYYVKLVNSFAFIKQYKDSKYIIESLRNRVSQLESQIVGYSSLQVKYLKLLDHSKVSSKKYSYIESSIYTNSNSYGYLVDRGSKEGVEVGDIVVFQNIYLGKILKVDTHSSLIKRPQDIGSLIPVIIIRDKNILNLQTDKLQVENINGVKALAVGKNEQIVIENIPNNNLVKEGDIVLTASSEIGQYLVLGKVENLKSDSAASVLTAKVKLIVDIYSINYVYIRNDK